jgi:hypothetical protein
MIERAFRQLPPKLQAAAILALVDERPYPEIADLLGAPVGRGRKLLAQTNRIVDAVLGGWTVSGISRYQTGAPSSVTFLVPGGYIGWQGGRADLVAGADIYAGQHDSHDVINGVPWFNTAAFAPPQPWQYGNSERNLLYGPGVWNWDIGVRKLFRITETSQLQFRVDFLNAFNHANLDFGREYQQQGGGATTVIADTRDGGLPDPRSGKIFSAGTFPGPRVIQLGLKLEF